MGGHIFILKLKQSNAAGDSRRPGPPQCSVQRLFLALHRSRLPVLVPLSAQESSDAHPADGLGQGRGLGTSGRGRAAAQWMHCGPRAQRGPKPPAGFLRLWLQFASASKASPHRPRQDAPAQPSRPTKPRARNPAATRTNSPLPLPPSPGLAPRRKCGPFAASPAVALGTGRSDPQWS